MSTSWKERAEEIGSTAAWRCHVLYIALLLPKPPTAEHIIACNCYLHTLITQQYSYYTVGSCNTSNQVPIKGENIRPHEIED